MTRPKKHALKFRDILFIKIIQDASDILTRAEVVSVFNAVIFRQNIPLSLTAPIKSNYALNEIVAHLREVGLLNRDQQRLVFNPDRALRLWHESGMNPNDWKTWAVTIPIVDGWLDFKNAK